MAATDSYMDALAAMSNMHEDSVISELGSEFSMDYLARNFDNEDLEHAGGYSATWFGITHIDVAYTVKSDADARGVKWSLKPYAQSIGLDPIEVDRERMHELTPEELRGYVASDATVTLSVAKWALGLL